MTGSQSVYAVYVETETTVDSSAKMNQLTIILQRLEKGEAAAANELLPLIYDELRKLAAMKMAREQPGQTLQPTALVHEAYLRLLGQ